MSPRIIAALAKFCQITTIALAVTFLAAQIAAPQPPAALEVLR